MRVRFPWFDAFIRIVLVFFLSSTMDRASPKAPAAWSYGSVSHVLSGLIHPSVHMRWLAVCAAKMSRSTLTRWTCGTAHWARNCLNGCRILGKQLRPSLLKVAIPDSSLREGKRTLHCNWRLRCRMLSFWPVSFPRENWVFAVTLCRKLFSHSLRFSEPTSNIHKLFAGTYRSLDWSFFSGWASLRDVLLRFHVPPLTRSVLHMTKPSCFALRISVLSWHRRHQVRKGPWPRKGPKFVNSLDTLDGHVPVWYWPCDQAKHLFITSRQHQWNRTVEWILDGKIGDAKMYRGRKSYIYIYTVLL